MPDDPNDRAGFGKYGTWMQLGIAGIMCGMFALSQKWNHDEQVNDRAERAVERTEWKLETKEARDLFWNKIGGRMEEMRTSMQALTDELRRNRLITGQTPYTGKAAAMPASAPKKPE